jgi:hypothetical protein
MKKLTRVSDLIPTRRDLLKFGGLSLAGATAGGMWPQNIARAETVSAAHPRGNAKNVIFYEISGAISHLDTFDYKENAGIPKDFDIKKLPTGMYFPVNQMPKIAKMMDKIATVRSLASNEEVHLRGEYYVQAGRQLNVAFAPEIPAIGSVIAYELENRRRENDTFPSYVSFNLETNQLGALSTGFLPPQFSAFDLDAAQALTGMTLDPKAMELVEERWRVLQQLREIDRKRVENMGRSIDAYEKFSITAKKLLTDPRWPSAFKLTDQDRTRYGNSGAGLGCALARNLLREDGGTHFVYICHFGWDHHRYIYDHSKPDNHYKLMGEFDPAISSLIEDLAVTPSKATPGKMLLDETLVVFMSEFGRTPGPLNHMAGRDHHKYCFPAMFAGAGVKGGLMIGASDKDANKCVETGWDHKEQPRIENVVATMYSALGIDWSKSIRNTPSGRAYTYVDPISASTGYVHNDELSAIYG